MTGDTRMTGFPADTAGDSGSCSVVLVALVTEAAAAPAVVTPPAAGVVTTVPAVTVGPFTAEEAAEDTGARMCCPLAVCTIWITPPATK